MARRRFAAMLLLVAAPAMAQNPDGFQAGVDGARYVPVLNTLLAPRGTESELRDIVTRFKADEGALGRRWNVEYSPGRRARFREYYRGWQAALGTLDFDRLSQQGRIDYVLMNHTLRNALSLLDREERMWTESAPVLPFGSDIFALVDARRRMEKLEPQQAALTLVAIGKKVEDVSRAIVAGLQQADTSRTRSPAPRPEGEVAPLKVSKVVAHRSAELVNALKADLKSWYDFYAGYDPLFTWWARDPYRRADSLMTAYYRTIRERILGFRQGQPDPIIGDPIGRDAIIADLRDELIAYDPEDLVKIAEIEFAWSEAEMKKASRELGFGDNWKAALDKVKERYVPPGEQPELIRRLAAEAVEFIEARDLVTVPPLAKDIWRIEMMSPERQRVSPFFLGGEVIQGFVSHRRDDARGEAHEHAREQPAPVPRDRPPRADPGASPPGLHELPLPGAPACGLRHAVLDRGLGALLGNAALGPGIQCDARGPRRGALLAHASQRADHLLARVPPGHHDAAAGDRLPCRPGRPRAGQRRGRGAAQLPGHVSASVPARLHDGRPAVPLAAPGAGRVGPDDEQGVP